MPPPPQTPDSRVLNATARLALCRSAAFATKVLEEFPVKKSLLALALVCLFTLPAIAATSDWQIVRAEYGSGNKWVDVTDRVQSLVKNDVLNLTVSADALGQPARRGRNRVLRMQLKDAHGKPRQVSYRDRQQVSFRVNTSSYLSSLRITRATYGSAYRSADVTARLNSQIQGNQLQMRVNNDSMGG